MPHTLCAPQNNVPLWFTEWPAEKEEEEEEKSAETSEEEADRVLAAVDKGLVALSSDKGGVPYYRLHRVVAKAIRRKKFIFVSEDAVAVAVRTAAGMTSFALAAHLFSTQRQDSTTGVPSLSSSMQHLVGWVFELDYPAIQGGVRVLDKCFVLRVLGVIIVDGAGTESNEPRESLDDMHT